MMTYSKELFEKVKEFEGLSLNSVVDVNGLYIIGYGHTQTYQKPQTITETYADTLLRIDLDDIAKYLREEEFNLTQRQYDGLCDLIYNIGQGKFRTSTLRKLLCSHAANADIAAQIMRWCHVKNRISKGLWNRRRWDASGFMEEAK